MGRTLELLKRTQQDAAPPAVVPSTDPDEPEKAEAAAETSLECEMPFIEVGGPGKSVEGSPTVLTGGRAKPAVEARPSLIPVMPQTVTLTGAGPRSVSLLPC